MIAARRLDFGVASFGNPLALEGTLTALREKSQTDWRCLIVSNLHPDAATHASTVQVIERHVAAEGRIRVQWREDNIGYAGAVNEIIRWAETPFVGYMDNDAVPLSEAWDEKLAWMLEHYAELKIAMVFPNGGSFPIARAGYQEILWGVGYCWMVRKDAAIETVSHQIVDSAFASRPQYFDESLGHQDEPDFQTRLRLAGWKIACDPRVQVLHAATATNNPESEARIRRGVINWVNKWCRYFGGKQLTYHSPNVLRHEDWPPTALYLEEYWLQHYPDLNRNPEVLVHENREYDLIRVPRYKNFYRGRII